jgi:hypothetical protein
MDGQEMMIMEMGFNWVHRSLVMVWHIHSNKHPHGRCQAVIVSWSTNCCDSFAEMRCVADQSHLHLSNTSSAPAPMRPEPCGNRHKPY